jgi:hypothetical protein
MWAVLVKKVVKVDKQGPEILNLFRILLHHTDLVRY